MVLNHEQRQWTNTSSGLAVKSGARGLSLIDSGPPRRRPSTLSQKGNLLIFLVYFRTMYFSIYLLVLSVFCSVNPRLYLLRRYIFFVCQLSTATRAKRAF